MKTPGFARIVDRPVAAFRTLRENRAQLLEAAKREASNGILLASAVGVAVGANELPAEPHIFHQVAALASAGAGQVIANFVPAPKRLSAEIEQRLKDGEKGHGPAQRLLDRWTGFGLPAAERAELRRTRARNTALAGSGAAMLVGLTGHVPSDVAFFLAAVGGTLFKREVDLKRKPATPEEVAVLKKVERQLAGKDPVIDANEPEPKPDEPK